MNKKTIKERMLEIDTMTEELKKLLQSQITYNKIWLPTVGVVTLWETKN